MESLKLKLVNPDVVKVIPPRVKRYVGATDSQEMQQLAMELFPIPNDRGELYMAQRWLEAIRYLRRRKKWVLDKR